MLAAKKRAAEERTAKEAAAAREQAAAAEEARLKAATEARSRLREAFLSTVLSKIVSGPGRSYLSSVVEPCYFYTEPIVRPAARNASYAVDSDVMAGGSKCSPGCAVVPLRCCASDEGHDACAGGRGAAGAGPGRCAGQESQKAPAAVARAARGRRRPAVPRAASRR